MQMDKTQGKHEYMHDNFTKAWKCPKAKQLSVVGWGYKSICMQVQPSHKEPIQKAEIFWALKVAFKWVSIKNM
ncbi:hypothetical protein DPMN_179896 [Dreissena polymorpha]|uniref:Uncharacterized protein n=1 Tax=Dreissena polymorpha TaxID=45954 RepID=A0A9D4EFM2_DREPO|nr:hypothetical protein DPMN_179896 [Dreissena polymorpha]